ncbi:hypothetical protein FNV43_RR12382 [Rhamnella rubrinervis]|uniref:CCDC93 coiled-coil domain-containing protein n=1 Tax=Rhamnella rubrinervis TaxID=2594499 RepID=A0A8K0MIL0_9ROSA|nr:hypothetical protein FNV43_RR12382 [Rhamnella rubrinervis]
MDESPKGHHDLPNRFQPIFNALVSAGYADAHKLGVSESDKLLGALVCEVGKHIEESLKWMKCPYTLEASQIQNLDADSVIPAVQWLLDCLRSSQADANYEFSESTTQFGRKDEVVKQLQRLSERIKEGPETEVHKLVSLMHSLKDLERQEYEFQSYSNVEHSQLLADIIGLEDKIANGYDNKSLIDGLDHLSSELVEEVNSARKELAANLKAILAVKRQLDNVPSQLELIQYERRFSELYVHIQGKHQQTQKYYDTYNALLEIKELMLKEISLLNSISSQFQDAITTTAGRMKLIDSMEGIVKSSQQKLEKVQLGLQDDHKVCDALKEKYSAAIAEQRHLYTLLKAFQGECAKNARLRSTSTV